MFLARSWCREVPEPRGPDGQADRGYRHRTCQDGMREKGDGVRAGCIDAGATSSVRLTWRRGRIVLVKHHVYCHGEEEAISEWANCHSASQAGWHIGEPSQVPNIQRNITSQLKRSRVTPTQSGHSNQTTGHDLLACSAGRSPLSRRVSCPGHEGQWQPRTSKPQDLSE